MTASDSKTSDGPRAFQLAEPVGPDDHVLGPADAPVIVVEYGDFECPNCKQAEPAVKLLLTRFSGKFRFVYRHFPVEANHPHAIQAAEAAETANAQGKFWPMHKLLFDNQSHLEIADLRKYAGSLDMDLALFDFQMAEHLYRPIVLQQLDSGRKSGVRSTPTFFVNDRIQDVSYGLQSLADAIDKVLNSV